MVNFVGCDDLGALCGRLIVSVNNQFYLKNKKEITEYVKSIGGVDIGAGCFVLPTNKSATMFLIKWN